MQLLQSNPELMKKYQEEVTKMKHQTKKEIRDPLDNKDYKKHLKNG